VAASRQAAANLAINIAKSSKPDTLRACLTSLEHFYHRFQLANSNHSTSHTCSAIFPLRPAALRSYDTIPTINMFKRLWSGLPEDPVFPSDLKGLG
jgi:hypothetical protein